MGLKKNTTEGNLGKKNIKKDTKPKDNKKTLLDILPNPLKRSTFFTSSFSFNTKGNKNRGLYDKIQEYLQYFFAQLLVLTIAGMIVAYIMANIDYGDVYSHKLSGYDEQDYITHINVTTLNITNIEPNLDKYNEYEPQRKSIQQAQISSNSIPHTEAHAETLDGLSKVHSFAVGIPTQTPKNANIKLFQDSYVSLTEYIHYYFNTTVDILIVTFRPVRQRQVKSCYTDAELLYSQQQNASKYAKSIKKVPIFLIPMRVAKTGPIQSQHFCLMKTFHRVLDNHRNMFSDAVFNFLVPIPLNVTENSQVCKQLWIWDLINEADLTQFWAPLRSRICSSSIVLHNAIE